MYHISPMTRKNFKCIYNFIIQTKKRINCMNTMETVTGKVPRMLILKKGENLKGNCSAWNKKPH